MQELSRDLWRLKFYLINRENDLNDELSAKNLTVREASEQAKKLQASGEGKQYPYLNCEKRIYDLAKKLWEKRDAIETHLFHECPK